MLFASNKTVTTFIYFERKEHEKDKKKIKEFKIKILF